MALWSFYSWEMNSCPFCVKFQVFEADVFATFLELIFSTTIFDGYCGKFLGMDYSVVRSEWSTGSHESTSSSHKSSIPICDRSVAAHKTKDGSGNSVFFPRPTECIVTGNGSTTFLGAFCPMFIHIS